MIDVTGDNREFPLPENPSKDVLELTGQVLSVVMKESKGKRTSDQERPFIGVMTRP
jgi:hypothetical protein